MCGIAGIFAYHPDAPPVNQEALLRMSEHMKARGPDGDGLFFSEDRRLGLAHRRLAIIDLSDAASQPMRDPDTGNQIVFNGEIYNYRELREELIRKGVRFFSASDTEVLLKLYGLFGPQMLDKIRGMYAFAIWDKHKKGTFLVRDPFGIKPLYIADDGKTFRFASQVKSLITGGSIDTSLEPAGHVGFFLWGHVPEPFTFYKGIRALPAGEWLWIDAYGRKERGRFFNLTELLSNRSSDGVNQSISEPREVLRQALLDTVRHHLVADVPVGIFLSAGMDSTTLAALSREVGVKELLTATLGFREFIGTQNDEVPLAEATARAIGSKHHTYWVNQNDFEQRLDHLFASMDQPTIDGVNTYFVSLAAHEAGLKVTISGLGGDELFAGYPGFQQIPRLVRAIWPIGKIPFLGKGFRVISSPLLKQFTSSKYAGIFEYGTDWSRAYLLRRSLFMPWELPEILDGELVREGWRALNTLPALSATINGIKNDHLRMTALEISWYMRNQLLRDTDWASMAHSLEVRVPFVDIEFVRCISGLINSGQSMKKQDLVSALSNSLPKELTTRPKTGFTVPVREWLIEGQHQLNGNKPITRGLRGWAKVVYERF